MLCRDVIGMMGMRPPKLMQRPPYGMLVECCLLVRTKRNLLFMDAAFVAKSFLLGVGFWLKAFRNIFLFMRSAERSTGRWIRMEYPLLIFNKAAAPEYIQRSRRRLAFHGTWSLMETEEVSSSAAKCMIAGFKTPISLHVSSHCQALRTLRT